MTLGEEYPIQQARVREVLGIYRDLGPIGQFGAVAIEDVLRRADRAAATFDAVDMLRMLQEMRDVK